MSGTRWRFAVVAAIGVTLLVVGAWWSGTTQPTPDEFVTRDSRPSDGLATEAPEPVDEGSTRVAAIGGGFVVVSGGTTGDLASYSIGGEEQWRVDLPFASPLYQADVGDAGSGLIVVTGIPCAAYDDTVDLTDPCDPGGVRGAVYDTRVEAWTGEPVVLSEQTGVSRPLGSFGGAVVVQVGLSVVTIDPSTMQVRQAPLEAETAASQMCIVDGVVAAVVPLIGGVVPDLEPGAVTEYVEGPTSPVLVSVLDLDTASWMAAPSAPPSDHNGAVFVGCASDGLVVVSGEGSVPLAFDPASGEWSELPSRPPAGIPVASADDDGRLVLFSGRDAAEVQILQEGGRWTTASRGGSTDPIGDVLSVAILGDRYAMTDRSAGLEFGRLV